LSLDNAIRAAPGAHRRARRVADLGAGVQIDEFACAVKADDDLLHAAFEPLKGRACVGVDGGKRRATFRRCEMQACADAAPLGRVSHAAAAIRINLVMLPPKCDG
jgi:hypothetical protein